jgi:hypothetical protein
MEGLRLVVAFGVMVVFWKSSISTHVKVHIHKLETMHGKMLGRV